MIVPKYSTRVILETIENRFKDVANLEGDFSYVPLSKEHQLQVATNKVKSNSFGEVFTPLWLVDSMIERIPDFDWRNHKKTTLDLCSGYGQFTIRILRKKYDLMGNKFDIKNFLFNTHFFLELQLSSCYKLLHIYSPKINLFIGDAKELKSIPENCNGIWYYKSGWNDCTDTVKDFFDKPKRKYCFKTEEKFVELMQGLINES